MKFYEKAIDQFLFHDSFFYFNEQKHKWMAYSFLLTLIKSFVTIDFMKIFVKGNIGYILFRVASSRKLILSHP